MIIHIVSFQSRCRSSPSCEYDVLMPLRHSESIAKIMRFSFFVFDLFQKLPSRKTLRTERDALSIPFVRMMM